jgi:hypothetical protein
MRRLTLLPIAVGLLAISAPAGQIFYEGFDYSIGGLNALNGGTGWSSPWIADATTTQIVNPLSALTYQVPGGNTINGGNRALQITPPPTTAAVTDAIIARSLPTQTGDVYFSFLFRENSGVIDTNDFLSFWFDNNNTVDPGQTLIPSLGLKGNHGDGSSTLDFGSRLNLGSDVYSTAATTGTTYLIVGRLFKSVPGGTYNRFSLWVDPTAGSAGTPDVTASVTTGSTSSFSRLGVRIANLDTTPKDVIFVDEFRAGTTFADALATPEPAACLLVSFGLIGLGIIRRRKIPAR